MVIIASNIPTGFNSSELIHRSPPVARKRRTDSAGELQFCGKAAHRLEIFDVSLERRSSCVEHETQIVEVSVARAEVVDVEEWIACGQSRDQHGPEVVEGALLDP